MKGILLFGLLFFGKLCFAQTDSLIKVPGTKCSLVPPHDFVVSSSFSGFQNDETGASIMISEIPAPYQTISDGFTANALETRGMKLLSKQAIDFNSSTAILINVKQPANGTTYFKQMLVFGDAEQTVLVSGIYPETSKSIASRIKEALLTTVYTPSQNENPIEAAAFSVNVENTDFKLVRYMVGSLLYSTDGKIPTENPTLIVGNSIGIVNTQNRKKYAEERLKKLPGGELIVLKQINEITIDNLHGYEIIANRKAKNNVTELLYQVMLFNDKSGYYIIVGQAREKFQDYLETFRKVSKTFKRK